MLGVLEIQFDLFQVACTFFEGGSLRGDFGKFYLTAQPRISNVFAFKFFDF